jgi:hypothetical protein
MSMYRVSQMLVTWTDFVGIYPEMNQSFNRPSINPSILKTVYTYTPKWHL